MLAVVGLRLPLSGWWRALRRDGENFQPGCTLPTGGIEMNADEGNRHRVLITWLWSVEFDQLRRLSAVLLIEKSLARCSGDHLALDRRCLKRAGADAGLSVNEPHPRVDEKGSPRLSSHPPTIPGDT